MARSSLKNVMRLVNIEKEKLSPEQSFLEDLKRSIELTDMKNSQLPSKTFKPSSMNCIRASYYQIMGKPIDNTGSSYVSVGICNSGSDIHERIQQAVSEMILNNMDCEYVDVGDYLKKHKIKDVEIKSKIGFETKLYSPKYNISFMCDGIIKYKNHYYILEFKTETSNKFFMRKEVDISHYKQGTAYSLLLRINEVIFVYISRDTLDMKSFMFTPTDEMKQDLIAYIDECTEYVNLQTSPPKPLNVEKKTCQYCNYKTQCRKDG